MGPEERGVLLAPGPRGPGLLPGCGAAELGGGAGPRPVDAQVESAPVGVGGGAGGVASRREHAAHGASGPGASGGWGDTWSGPRSGPRSGRGLGLPLARRGARARPLALHPGQEVVAVAVATAVPEVDAPGGQDVVVVARNPDAAGAGGSRQRADGALD